MMMAIFLKRGSLLLTIYDLINSYLYPIDWLKLISSRPVVCVIICVNAITLDPGMVLATINMVSNSWNHTFSWASTFIGPFVSPWHTTLFMFICVISPVVLCSLRAAHTMEQMFHLTLYHLVLFTTAPILTIAFPEVIEMIYKVLSFYVEQCANVITFLSPALVYLFNLVVWIVKLHSCLILLSVITYYVWGTTGKFSFYVTVIRALRVITILRLAVFASLVFSIITLPEVFLEHYSGSLDPSEMVNTNVMPTLSSLFSMIVPVAYCEEECIPYVQTYLLQAGVDSLVRMYDHQPDGSVLKQYLTDNCSHLLEPLQGSTGIPINKADVNYLKKHVDTIQLESQYRASFFAHLKVGYTSSWMTIKYTNVVPILNSEIVYPHTTDEWM